VIVDGLGEIEYLHARREHGAKGGHPVATPLEQVRPGSALGNPRVLPVLDDPARMPLRELAPLEWAELGLDRGLLGFELRVRELRGGMAEFLDLD
jgi:hypothetical protein